MRHSPERLMMVGFAVVVVIILFITGISIRISARWRELSEWVSHTQEARTELARTLSAMNEAETSQRAYIILGNNEDLKAFRAARARIDPQLTRVTTLLSDNPRQQQYMKQLRADLNYRFFLMDGLVQVRQDEGYLAAYSRMTTGMGKQAMEAVYRDIAEMDREEASRLVQHNSAYHTYIQTVTWVFAGLCLVVLIALGVVFFGVRHILRARQQAFEQAQNARTIVEEKADRLASVISIQEEITLAKRGLDEVLRIVVERTQAITQAEGGVVELLEGDEMVYRAASGSAGKFIGLRLKAAGSLSGLCVRERQVLQCDDAETDSRVDKEACRKIGVRSMLVVPLHHNQATIGVLKVLSSRAYAFNREDIATLQLMAGVIAAAMSQMMVMETKQLLLEERERAMQTLQRSEERFRTAISAMHEGLIIQSREEGFVVCNESAERILGLSTAEMKGLDTLDPRWQAIHEDGTPWSGDTHPVAITLQDGTEQLGAVMGLPKPDGEMTWVSINSVPLTHDGEMQPYAAVATFSDITEQRWFQEQLEEQIDRVHEVNARLISQQSKLSEANARLEALATTDGLTGIKNHRAFQEKIAEEFDRACRYNSPLSLLVLDVDHFKQFNDTFGHPVGDKILKQVASVLQGAVRSSDIVARYGGEEFVVILPATTSQGAMEMAERVRLAIAEQTWEHRAITVSVGVSSLHPTIETVATLFQEADTALYESKKGGRNMVTYFDTKTHPE